MAAKSNTFRINASGVPKPTGLYDPQNDHDSCGVGFIARIDGVSLHAVVEQGIRILVNLEHRAASASSMGRKSIPAAYSPRGGR